MTKIYSYTVPLDTDVVDAFCVLQKGFTDQFVYYDKERPFRVLGLGRCIALSSLEEADIVLQAPEGGIEETGAADVEAIDVMVADGAVTEAVVPDVAAIAPTVPTTKTAIFFSFNRFDQHNPSPADEMMQAFPQLKLMLPEVVLIEDKDGSFLQVNSLGPVYAGRVERFVRHARQAMPRQRRSIAYEFDNKTDSWEEIMALSLSAIHEGRVSKLVPSRRQHISTDMPFSSKDVLVNLIDGAARGTVFLYRYGDVFFCGCTPELLVRKSGSLVTSMCLAGTTEAGETIEDSKTLADELIHDEKNRREHAYVVQFMREVFSRNCYNVEIPEEPFVLSLKHVQHLCTPVQARVMEGKTLLSLAEQLHPTPALAGYPVGEALMCLREIEPYNRGFFGGAVGVVDGCGDGEFSVAIRSGVFDGEQGWVYAGCGVVEGSQTADELSETDLKFKTILSAFEGQ